MGNPFLWPVNSLSIMHEPPSQWEKQFNSPLSCLWLNRGSDLKQWSRIHMNAVLTKGPYHQLRRAKVRGCMTLLSVKVRKQATFLSQVTFFRSAEPVVSNLWFLRSTRTEFSSVVAAWGAIHLMKRKNLEFLPVCLAWEQCAGCFLQKRSHFSP